MSYLLLFHFALVFNVPGEPAMLPSEVWLKKVEEHRRQKDISFKKDNRSPMYGSNRYTYSSSSLISVGISEGKLVIDDSLLPYRSLLVKFENGIWHWTEGEKGVQAFSGTKFLSLGPIPSGSYFKIKGFTVSVYASAKKISFICFNPNRDTGKTFSHLRYFKPDPDYNVQAEIIRLKTINKVTMLTSQNQEKTYYRYAKLKFKIQEKTFSLFAYKMSLEGDMAKYLFIPFTDLTTGKESYGAGRYIEMEEPAGQKVQLDFNLAFNPLCNYSPAYNCPVPLDENALEIPIRAGEKTYPIH